jgi:hypothetical protein
MNVTLTLDGVLRSPTGTPNRTGRDLFTALAHDHTLYILTDRAYDETIRWLKLNQFQGYAQLLTVDHAHNGRSEKIRRAKQTEQHITFVQRVRHSLSLDLAVEADPAVAAGLYHLGLPTLLLTHPVYARPLDRPDHDHQPTPWQQLAETIEEDRLGTPTPEPEND